MIYLFGKDNFKFYFVITFNLKSRFFSVMCSYLLELDVVFCGLCMNRKIS